MKNITKILPQSKTWGLYHGRMGWSIYLFHYAYFYNIEQFNKEAYQILDEIFEYAKTSTDLEYGNGLFGIGTGIEYLSQNNLLKVNTDHTLKELDKILSDTIIKDTRKDLSLSEGICGWLRYTRFRLKNHSLKKNDSQLIENKYTLLLLLERLSCHNSISLKVCTEIIEELTQLCPLNLYTSHISYLLNYFQEKKTKIFLKTKEENKNCKNSCYINSIGLKGIAGQQLYSLNLNNTWKELL